MPGRKISDQLQEALGSGSMYDELSSLEDQFLWEEEPSKDPETDQALEPNELSKQQKRIQSVVKHIAPSGRVSSSTDTPGDFLVTVPPMKDPVHRRSVVVKVEKGIRNLGLFVTPSKDGLKLYVYAEKPEPPPMEGGGGGGGAVPPKAPPKAPPREQKPKPEEER